MPLVATKLDLTRAHVTFEYLGETVHLDYYPDRITPQRLSYFDDFPQRLAALTTEAEGEAMLLECATWLCEVFAGWDLLEAADGPPMPITPERVARLLSEQDGAQRFIGCCLEAVVGQMSLGKPNGSDSLPISPSTSSPKGSAASRPRNGSRTSRSRGTRG